MSWWGVRHWVRRRFVREDGEDANVKREDEGVAVEDDAWAEGGVHDWSRSSGHDEMQKGANTITYALPKDPLFWPSRGCSFLQLFPNLHVPRRKKGHTACLTVRNAHD